MDTYIERREQICSKMKQLYEAILRRSEEDVVHNKGETTSPWEIGIVQDGAENDMSVGCRHSTGWGRERHLRGR